MLQTLPQLACFVYNSLLCIPCLLSFLPTSRYPSLPDSSSVVLLSLSPSASCRLSPDTLSVPYHLHSVSFSLPVLACPPDFHSHLFHSSPAPPVIHSSTPLHIDPSAGCPNLTQPDPPITTSQLCTLAPICFCLAFPHVLIL